MELPKSTSLQSFFFAIVVAGVSSSCQYNDELPFVASSDNTQNQNQRSDNASMRHPESMFGSGQTEVNDMELANESYPLLSLKGTGTLNHRKGDANIVQDMTAHVTANKYEFNVTRFNATGGKERKRVDKAIRSQTGMTSGVRSDRVRLRNLQRNEEFGYEPFIIYADNANTADGKNFTFPSPLPVFIAPAPLSRFEAFPTGRSLTYTTQVTGASSFTVNTTVRRSSSPDDPIVRITIEHIIPEDSQGRLYQQFPMARESVFYINTEEQSLRRVDVVRHYHDDDRKRSRIIRLDYRVCSANQDGTITTIENC